MKDEMEKVMKLKEDVEKHKREIEELEKKLATYHLAQTKFEAEVEKRFKALQQKIEGVDEH